MRRWGSRGALKVLPGKCPARSGLQVLLERDSTLFVSERNISSQPPRAELRRMRHLASIMFLQTGAQVIRHTHVEMQRIQTFENVDVSHRVSPSPERQDIAGRSCVE